MSRIQCFSCRLRIFAWNAPSPSFYLRMFCLLIAERISTRLWIRDLFSQCTYVHIWWSCLGMLMNVAGFRHVGFCHSSMQVFSWPLESRTVQVIQSWRSMDDHDWGSSFKLIKINMHMTFDLQKLRRGSNGVISSTVRVSRNV